MIPGWVERYIGIPFTDEGYGFSGCHCWGLVRLVYLQECRIDLPTYGEISWRDLHEVARAIETDSRRDPWVRVGSDLGAFDVVIMRGRPQHVGVTVNATHILHVEERTSAVCVPLAHSSVRGRVLASFRHKALVNDQAAIA